MTVKNKGSRVLINIFKHEIYNGITFFPLFSQPFEMDKWRIG